MQTISEGGAETTLPKPKKKKKPRPLTAEQQFNYAKTGGEGPGYRAPELRPFVAERNAQTITRWERERKYPHGLPYNPPGFRPSSSPTEALERAKAVGYTGILGAKGEIKNPMLLDVLTHTVQSVPPAVQQWIRDHGIRLFIRGRSQANPIESLVGIGSPEYAGMYIGTPSQHLGPLATPANWIYKGGTITIMLDPENLKNKAAIRPYLRGVLFHEIGHALDYSTDPQEHIRHVGKAAKGGVAGRISQTPEFYRPKNAPYAMEGFDDYYLQNNQEGFAEVFARYMNSEQEREALDPGIRAFLDRLLAPTLPTRPGGRIVTRDSAPPLPVVANRLKWLKNLLMVMPIREMTAQTLHDAFEEADREALKKFVARTLPGATMRAAERTRDEASGELQKRYLRKLGY